MEWGLRDYGVEGQLGLEQTPQQYVKNLCDVFDKVWRVLRDDGSLWVNLGDSYNRSSTKPGTTDEKMKWTSATAVLDNSMRGRSGTSTMKSKTLVGIPQRFMIEMIDRGWICRNDIIWQKPNAIPSSAKDRFTVDYEHFFWFLKKEKYYFDTRYEPYAESTLKEIMKYYNGVGKKDYNSNNVQNPSDVKRRIVESVRTNIRFGGNKAAGYGNPVYSGKEWSPNMGGGGSTFRGHSGFVKADGTFAIDPTVGGRIMRCVWKIPHASCSLPHFASFPEKLIVTPIEGCCPLQICTKCGTPRKTIVDTVYLPTRPGLSRKEGVKSGTEQDPNKSLHDSDWSRLKPRVVRTAIGTEGCDCDAGFEPGIVLDPFAGIGTTAIAAARLGRNWIGIELSQHYVQIAERRYKEELAKPVKTVKTKTKKEKPEPKMVMKAMTIESFF